MSTTLEATPPTMVDATTAHEPCRPGAWGDATSCATHEGQPLDEDGKCFWSRKPSFLEKVFTASIQHDKPPVVLDPGLVDMRALMSAPSSGLLRLARALDVRPPGRQPGDDDRKVKERFARALLDAVALDRVRQPLVKIEPRPVAVVDPRSFGTITTTGRGWNMPAATVTSASPDPFADFLALHPLPDMVRVISLHQPFAGLVCAGLKTLETRRWPWPYPPGWLVVHAAKRCDPKAVRKFGAKVAPFRSPQGVLLGLVWVDGCRPLVPEDEARAWAYEPNRFAWELKHARTFTRAVPMVRGPQKFASVMREMVVHALAA